MWDSADQASRGHRLLLLGALTVSLCAVPAGAADGDEPPPAPAEEPAPAVERLEPASDDSDPINITAEQARESRSAPIDGAFPIFDRPSVHRADAAVDGLHDRMDRDLSLGVAPELTLIWQGATTGGGDNAMLLANFDLPAVWTPVERDDWLGDGSLGFLFRYRDEYLGTTPGAFADSVGINFLNSDTGVGEDAYFAILQLWWEQRMVDDQLVVRAGRVDQGAFLDGNRYAGSDKQYFLAEPLSTGNPNRRFPQEGLGFNVAVDPEGVPFYAAVGMHDANAISNHSGFDTIDQGDFFFGGQVAYTPLIGGLGQGYYRATGTYSMPNPAYGEAWSVMFSFDQDLDPHQLGAFLRYGVSDGKDLTLDQQFSTGVVFRSPFGYADDRAGVGVFWFGVDGARDNDFGLESFYRFQVARRVQLTPDAQLLFPSRNHDVALVLGVRLRMLF